MIDSQSLTKKILLCGDSFGVPDSGYPGLHFSEKISEKHPGFEIINLCRGGSTNFLIEMQVRQGMRFNPDYVIVLFTDAFRFEYSTDPSTFLHEQTAERVENPNPNLDTVLKFNHQKYITSCWLRGREKEVPVDDHAQNYLKLEDLTLKYKSHDAIKIANYFTVLSVLNLCRNKNIPVCFSLGGMDIKDDSDYEYLKSSLLKYHYLNNELEDFMDQCLEINLWNHYPSTAPLDGPVFHVIDSSVQNNFAVDCLNKLKIS